MAVSEQFAAPRSCRQLWLAAGFTALGCVVTHWLIDAMPGAPWRPRLAVAEGRLFSSGTSPAAASSARKDCTVVISDGDYTAITFDLLSGFRYAPPSQGAGGTTPTQERIPAAIRSLNGMRVAVQGFMLPLTQENGAVKTFCLVRDRSCCPFGVTPLMNHWVHVSMKKGRSARPVGEQSVAVFGRLAVGELYESGELLSIYRMEADQVVCAPGP